MEFPRLDVQDKVALVTGGSKGIGYAMALALAKYGADIVLVSRNPEEGEEAAGNIRKLGRKAVALKADVTDSREVQTAIDRALQEFGRIDILVNNAGMNIRKPVTDYAESEWDQVLNTNLKGVFLVAQAVGKVMIKQKKGKVINISSILGSIGMPWQAAYASSKGGINQLTKVLALEWAPYNIQVNAIAPTYIKTPMTAGWLSDPERYTKILDSTPMGRVGENADLVGPVVFLASEASNYITGQVIHVDGGWTAQ